MYICYFIYANYPFSKMDMYGFADVFFRFDPSAVPYDGFQDGDLRCNESTWMVPGTFDPRD